MPLIACADCGKSVSTSAKACPNCGCPVPEQRADGRIQGLVSVPQMDPATVLLKVRPSWWNFSWHLAAFVVALPLLIAFVPEDWWNWFWVVPVGWLVFSVIHTTYHRRSFVMRIYPDRVSVVEGFIAKETSEFFIKDIRSIDVRQGLWGRIVNIGDVTISTAATTEAAEEASGVPRPNQIRELLISRRQVSTAD
jgi:uncharacterized membrane protein YdbT with pleckstrin-like domain